MCELMLGVFTEASPSVSLPDLQNAGMHRLFTPIPAPFQVGAEKV
jgi:hypothetical protein